MLRLPPKHPELLLALQEVYRFESERVAGFHGGRPQFSPWTIDEVCTTSRTLDHDTLVALLDQLRQQGHLMELPPSDEHPKPRFATRTAELVRSIGTMHEYVARNETEGDDEERRVHLQMVDAVKWVPEMMSRPRRNKSSEDIVQSVERTMAGTSHVLDGTVSTASAVATLRLVLDGVATSFGLTNARDMHFSRFQVDAIARALTSAWLGHHEAQIVAAGTGSGKTITFAIPVLVDALLHGEHAPELAPWSQLLLYPRNDLAFDQYNTLQTYAACINTLLRGRNDTRRITLALDANGRIKRRFPTLPGLSEKWDQKNWMGDRNSVVLASKSRYGGRDPRDGAQPTRASNIIVASLESFRRRLIIPAVAKAARTHLSRVVLDEIHLSNGLQGGHTRGLFNRLHALRGSKGLSFIAASATIADPQHHVESIWGTQSADVVAIEPHASELDGAASGLVNHILVRPRPGVAKGGPVYNATSIVGHHLLDPSQVDHEHLDDPQSSAKHVEKMICFADSKQFVTQWQTMLNENEGAMAAMAFTERQVKEGVGGAIALPYSTWHDRPLAQLFTGQEGAKVCQSCQSGCYAPDPVQVGIDHVVKLRTKMGGQSTPTEVRMEAWSRPDATSLTISGLDTCPFLLGGTCWWFNDRPFAAGSGDRPPALASGTNEGGRDEALLERIITRPNMDDTTKLAVRGMLRSRRHTMDSRDGGADDGLNEEDEQFDANKLFLHTTGEAFPGKRSNTNVGQTRMLHNVIVATPTLEVGIDMDNVAVVMMHRAMRNISSYRQKAGRAGRENGSVAHTVTVLSSRSNEFEYFADQQRLISEPIRDVVPVANGNSSIMRMQAYMSVFDWLANKDVNFEDMWDPQWKHDMQKAVTLLNDHESDVVAWLKTGFQRPGTSLTPDQLRTTVRKVREQFEWLSQATFETLDGHRTVVDGILRAQKQGATFPDPIQTSASDVDLIRENILKSEINLPDVLSVKVRNLLEGGNTDAVEELCAAIAPTADMGFLDKQARENLIGSLREFNRLLEEGASLRDETAQEALAKDVKRKLNKAGKYYLSFLLPRLDLIREQTPFCYLESVFDNPHETTVPVYISDKHGRVPRQTLQQVLRDLLPGMWNGRTMQPGSGYYNVVDIGGEGVDHDTEASDHPRVFYVDLDGDAYDDTADPPSLGRRPRVTLLDRPQRNVAELPLCMRPPEANRDDSVTLVRPNSVRLRRWPGVEAGGVSIPTKVNFDTSTTPGLVVEVDIETSGAATQGMIPEAWPSTWTFTETRGGTPSMGYSPSRPSSANGGAALPVTSHPLFGRLFTSIQRDNEVQIERMVTHVARSRGITLRYRVTHNGTKPWAAYANSFETDALVFNVVDSLLDSSGRWDPSTEMFNVDSIKLLEHHLQRHPSLEGCLNGFIVQHLIRAMVLHAVTSSDGRFEASLASMVTELRETPLSEEITQPYILTLAESVREFVSDDFADVRGAYNVARSELWEFDSLRESQAEWSRMTMLNTLAIGLTNAASRFSGVESERIATALNIEEGTITLFDDDAEGNGTVATLARHFRISRAARAARGAMRAPPLPTSDFAREFERWMLTCEDHMVHRLAMDLHASRSIETNPYAQGLRQKAAQQLAYRSNVWKALNLTSLRQAGVYRRVSGGLVERANARSVSEVDQSLELCVDGCERCLGTSFGGAFPPGTLSERYASRLLLDQRLDLGRSVQGYGNAEDEHPIGLSNGVLESFTHWVPGNNQEFSYEDICVPETIGPYGLRDDGIAPLLVQRLVRLHDHRSE